jgi:hypothetical protein
MSFWKKLFGTISIADMKVAKVPKARSSSTQFNYQLGRQCRYWKEADGYTRGNALMAAYNDIKRAAPGPEFGKASILIDPDNNVNTLMATFKLDSRAVATKFSETVDSILSRRGFVG